ncbi:hypothetical protein E4U24_000172 [Claviceps purpurea]|nr:hypothetical protein E4U27_000458 [Claviceps purpurea]KAG6234760.1 hypothetical protein E4U24_000172 [Claviceps purpurea]KAG6238170.1 hypothetical protein E4U25_001957 [Claviceps purpurea]KAG6260420.1 hypothetical protein E4U47_000508 [Claviceps purpurea]
MPKKDYGEPTRRSERLGAQSLERSVKYEEVEEPALSTSRPESSPASPEPVEPAATTDTEPEVPVASIDPRTVRGNIKVSAEYGANPPPHYPVAGPRDQHVRDRQQQRQQRQRRRQRRARQHGQHNHHT